MRRFMVVAAICAPALASAQAPIPATPAGTAFKEYIAALNDADPVRLGATLEKYHASEKLDGQLQFAKVTGGFDILRIEASTEKELTALVAERASDTVAKMTIKLEVDASGQVKSTSFHAGAVPREGEFAIQRLTWTEAINAFETRVAQHAKADRFSGAYLISENGKVVAAKAYGWKDRAARIPNTLQTKFRIGSMNKMFTAIATLQLVQAGKLSLDGNVGTYLPDYPNSEIAAKVTIRQLLSHTGGTGDFFGPEFDANRLNLKTHRDYITLLGSRSPKFEPGTKDSYSNFGFLILGNIIERVSGVSYYEYVKKNVYLPAGMNDTDSEPDNEVVPGRARPYQLKYGKWVAAEGTLPYRGTSAGGGYSTVGDLMKFAEALQTDKLLPKAVVKDATSPHDHSGSYGYGFGVQQRVEGFDHGGGSQGMNAHLWVFPGIKRIVIIASNFDPPEADSLGAFYINRMPLSD